MILPLRLVFLALLASCLGPARLHASDASDASDMSEPMSLSDATYLQDDDALDGSNEEQPLPLSAGLSLDEVPTSQSAEPSAAGEPASDSEDLAKKVANPISNLISVPLQSNFSWG